MANCQKFLFDTSFDGHTAARPKKPVPEAVVPEEPKFSKEDLEAARAEGVASGHAQGYAEAQSTAEQASLQALTAIERALSTLAECQAEAAAASARDSLTAAMTVVRKLFPAFAKAHALDEIENVVGECLERLRDEPRVVVRVADDLLDSLRERLSPIARAAGFHGKIVLLSDETLQDSAVRVEWADGGAERDPAQTWREIDEMLARSLGPLQDAGLTDNGEEAMPATNAETEAGGNQSAFGLAQTA
jgi:flagellar assembly protein FliH